MEDAAQTDRETEAREVLQTLLSVKRIKDEVKDVDERSDKKQNSDDCISEKKLAQNVKESKMNLFKQSEERPQGSAAHLEDEDLDETIDLDVDGSPAPNVVEQDHELTCDEVEECAKSLTKKKTAAKGKQKRVKTEGEVGNEPTRLEDNALQVLERFKRGCECHEEDCFRELNPELVYRHRLNIAELTKAEHDMYLMGVTMACLTNPYRTARQTERRRLRAQYVYQGRRVCLDAFLYLENCTHYQLKRIRKHVITQGVTPRVHGNHGKVPHNTFSLDIYKIATEFLKSFIGKQKASAKQGALHLASDVTRKTVHDLYSNYCRKISPSIKIMGYSTFRRFMKVQFPQVKFAKVEFIVKGQAAGVASQSQNSGGRGGDIDKRENELVPFVIDNDSVQQNGDYILTPVNKLRQGVSYQLTNDGFLVKSCD